MNWTRYLIIGLALAIITSTFVFTEKFTYWLNKSACLVDMLTSPEYIIIRPLVGLLMMLIGFVLTWVGRPPRFNRISWGIFLFALGGFIVLVAIFGPADAFIVGATLALAFAAFLSFKESRQLRSDNTDRELRDRKERLLNEIIQWATNIAKCETSAPLTPFPAIELAKSAKELGKQMAEIIFEAHERNIRVNLIMRYQSLSIMRERIVLIAKKLDKQFSCNLGDLAQETADKLDAHVDLGEKFISREVTDNEYKTHWKSLVKNANSLAEKAEEAAD